MDILTAAWHSLGLLAAASLLVSDTWPVGASIVGGFTSIFAIIAAYLLVIGIR